MTERPLNFRDIGFTDEAINHRLSESGALIIAMHNGVQPHQMPSEFFYSSSAGMKEWIEALGEAHAAGRPCRDPNGRWWTMSRLDGKEELS
jgi:hypothetical protein